MARRPRFRRQRRFPVLRLLWRLAEFVALLWVAGFGVFLIYVLNDTPPDPMPHAGGIVALTGGEDRVRVGLQLLAARDAPLLLISGAGRGTYLGDFTVDNAAAATRYAAEITLGHMAGTTHGNAIEAANWAHAHHLHSLIIVTADYHMPRAMLEMRRALPGVRLVAAPVRPPGMGPRFSLKILRLLAGEYTKYLAVRLDLGRPAAVIVKQLD